MELSRSCPRPVIVTTDYGADIDDQWALAHHVLSAAFDVRVIVTTHAPNLAHRAAVFAARCAADVLNRLPFPHPLNVVAGSSAPLAARTPRVNSGTGAILRAAQEHGPNNRLVTLVLGAATDTASALLIDPILEDRIEIVAMGFDGWPNGGDGFNVCNDVTAWQVLLESTVPITVGDAAAGKRDLLMTPASARNALSDYGMAGRYLVQLLVDWLLAEAVTGDSDAWPVWDEITIAFLFGLATSTTNPRPSMNDDITFAHGPRNDGAIRRITEVDGEALWQGLRRSLRTALES